MAEIELVIKIPEEEYNIIKKSNAPMTWAEHLIKDGKPLPEHHGRLIDADRVVHFDIYDEEFEIYKTKVSTVGEFLEIYTDEGDAPTVIEASENDDCMFGDYMSPIV